MNTANTAFATQSTAFVVSPPVRAPDQQGGGAWGRVVGGVVDTQNTSVTSLSLSALPVPGSNTCNNTTTQDFAGFQVGHDIAKFNLGGSGANLHFGVTAGYLESYAREQGGTFKGNFQVPFAGLYAALAQGNFFADAQVRLDYYQNQLSDFENGLFGQTFNAHGTTVAGNVAYRVDLPSGYFIEPSAGVTWSRVNVDPLNITGTLALPFPPFPGISLPGTVQMDDIESLLGRASVRVGTNVVMNGIAFQPFVIASVFREFAGAVTTTTNADPTLLLTDFTATTTTSRVGTYYQVGAGLGVQILDTGWLGYGRMDYRTGENIDGLSVNVGLRYQFAPDPAGGSKGAPSGPARAHNWTGFYAGGFAGKAWGQQDWEYQVNDAQVKPDFGGYLLGGQLGYNYQMGPWVFGIQGDIGGSNAKGGSSCPALFTYTCEAELGWLGSVTARMGYAWNQSLLYVKGGLAVGEVTAQTSFNASTFPILGVFGPTPPVNGTTETRVGWTAGAGMEFALTKNWSAFAEYNYFNLGSDTYTVDNGLLVDADTQGHSVRVGVNYRFGNN